MLNKIDKTIAKLRGQDSEKNVYMSKAEIEKRAAMIPEDEYQPEEQDDDEDAYDWFTNKMIK
jgi:hypothetical protein